MFRKIPIASRKQFQLLACLTQRKLAGTKEVKLTDCQENFS